MTGLIYSVNLVDCTVEVVWGMKIIVLSVNQMPPLEIHLLPVYVIKDMEILVI